MRVFRLKDLISSSDSIKDSRIPLHGDAFQAARNHGINENEGKIVGNHRFRIVRDPKGQAMLETVRVN